MSEPTKAEPIESAADEHMPPPLVALAAQIMTLRMLVDAGVGEPIIGQAFDTLMASVKALAFQSSMIASALRAQRQPAERQPARPPVFHEPPAGGSSHENRPNPLDRL